MFRRRRRHYSYLGSVIEIEETEEAGPVRQTPTAGEAGGSGYLIGGQHPAFCAGSWLRPESYEARAGSVPVVAVPPDEHLRELWD